MPARILPSALLILLALRAGAQEAAEIPPLPAGVSVEARLEPLTATVGDPIRVEILVRAPEGYQVRFPQIGDRVGEFAVMESPVEGATGRGSTAATPEPGVHRLSFVASLYRVGEFELPPLEIRLQGPDGKEFIAPSPATAVSIESVLPSEDADLQELKRQAEIPDPVRWVLWLTSALLALLAGIVAWWWWRKQRRRFEVPEPAQIVLDPFAVTEAELRDLLARGLLEKGFIKQFYVALSEIVKKALEAGCHIPTAEKTTREILEGLRSAEDLAETNGDLDRIESFLEACDLVKFAKYTPPRQQSEAAIREAIGIIEYCKRQRSRPTPLAEAAPIAGTR